MSISASTKQLLWVRAGGRCSMPDCRKVLFRVAADGDPAFLGEMAHIVGKSEDGGPRCKSPVPGIDRDGYENLILLCPSCHTLIDKHEATYPPERLLQIRRDHERWVADQLSPEERFTGTRLPDASVTEQVFSSMMRVLHMPPNVFGAPFSGKESEVRSQIGHAPIEHLLPFVVREGMLYTFTDLSLSTGPFRGLVRSSKNVVRQPAERWWADSNRRNWYVSLLNRVLNKVTGRRGLHLDREHERYYFEPETTDQGDPLEKSVTYVPLSAKKTTRKVVWRPMIRKLQRPRSHWEHLAVGLRFQHLGAGAWVLTFRPERRFTKDGFEPVMARGIGARSTRRKARLYNFDVLGEVQFWRDYLFNSQPRLLLNFGGQSLVVDGQFLNATICWPGVPDDQKRFANVRYEDDLFSMAAYEHAVDGSSEVEVDEWEEQTLTDLEEEEPE